MLQMLELTGPARAANSTSRVARSVYRIGTGLLLSPNLFFFVDNFYPLILKLKQALSESENPNEVMRQVGRVSMAEDRVDVRTRSI